MQLRPSEERPPADAHAMRTDGNFGLGARDVMRRIMSAFYMIGGVAPLALDIMFHLLIRAKQVPAEPAEITIPKMKKGALL